MRHVDEGQLHAYLDGATDALEPGEADWIANHLASCEGCHAWMESERELCLRVGSLLDDGDGAPGGVLPPYEEVVGIHRKPSRRRPAMRPAVALAWAASVALALGIGWFARSSDPLESLAVRLESPETELDRRVAADQAEVAPTASASNRTVRSRAGPDDESSAAPDVRIAIPAAPPEPARSAASPEMAPPPVAAAASRDRPAAVAARGLPREMLPSESRTAGHGPFTPAVSPRTGEVETQEVAEAIVAEESPMVIRGVVTAESGAPLVGASITVAGLNLGTITRQDGSYALPVPPSARSSGVPLTIRANSIGHTSDSRTLAALPTMADTQNFVLKPEAVALEGIVAVGYGTREIYSMSSAVADVSTDPVASLGPWTPIDRTVAERVLGSALLAVPELEVMDIALGPANQQNSVRIRQRLESGDVLVLVLVNGPMPSQRENEVPSADHREESSARESADASEIAGRVGSVRVTATAPIPLDDLREMVARIR